MAFTGTLFPIAATDSTGRTSASVIYDGAGTALLTLLSSTWATDNPAIGVAIAIQQSFDGGATWQDMCSNGGSWHPGTFGKGGAMPAIQCQAVDVIGSRSLRALLSATQSIQVGIQATVS